MKKLLVFVVSLFCIPSVLAFSDTQEHWASFYIEELAAEGIVTGYEDGNFGPDDTLTRGQFAKVVALAFDLEFQGETDFTDVDADAWYASYIDALVSAGLAEGYGTGEFGPEDPVTRAQAVKILVLAAGLESETTESHFLDVSLDDWFFDYVETAYHYSLVEGYEDGRFAPNENVSRGEMAKMTVLAQGDDIFDNPFEGELLYVDPESHAARQVVEWAEDRPEDAQAVEVIASQPTAAWFGDWYDSISDSVDAYVSEVTSAGALPVMVIYNIPGRDCGNYSAGGSSDDSDYLTWIQDFARGVGERKAVVILEPDALSLDCLYESSIGLIAEAVSILKSSPELFVYIDAGHPDWVPVENMAERLKDAGIYEADGFALNVSNFYTTEENLEYGSALSEQVYNKHFIIDTSRNGNGWNGEWCNPSGRSLGENPTVETDDELLDALLWVKPPGESDGTCNGGPEAGDWWPEYALDLVEAGY